MSKVLVTESNLSGIAAAIRAKNGGSDTYKPGQMAAAIQALPDPATLVSKTIIANGSYDPEDDNADGYSAVTVDVPNSYAAGDEGKVVSNGALVAQTARATNITANGTYDTTENNEVTVNVSGGGGGGGSSDAYISFDFTKFSGTIAGVSYGSAGATFPSGGDAFIPILPMKNDITIYIDVASMRLSSGTHRRFIMNAQTTGFIYRSNGKWAVYSNNGWEESSITDGNFFDNSTVKVYVDASSKWHIYKNGTLVWEPTLSLSMAFNANAYMSSVPQIGSKDGNIINNAVITGLRIYNGNYTE